MGLQQHEDEDMATAALLLPEDVLAEVFRRLPPCSVAMFRCACRTWLRIIDEHGLLCLDCLPHSVDSIVLNLYGVKSSLFLSRPTTGDGAPATTSTVVANLDRAVSGELGEPSSVVYVKDHCNGLLLVHDCVVNPATGQLARLPGCPPPRVAGKQRFFYDNKYLAFDPLVSPYYEVFSVPRVRHLLPGVSTDPATEASQWPPSTYALHVFSSRTGRWEEKSFLREGGAAGTIKSMRKDTAPRKRYAVYWQGALYVHCETNFVMRISLSTGKYHVIKPVIGMEGRKKYPNIRLGGSENGVYCCALVRPGALRVWFLSESSGQTHWVLKHSSNLWSVLPPPHRTHHDEESGGTWTLSHRVSSYQDEDNEAPADEGEKIERDPDSGTIMYAKYRPGLHRGGYIALLGFHPYEEVVFLGVRFIRGPAFSCEEGVQLVGVKFGREVACSAVTALGNICLPFYKDSVESPYVDAAFVYTPCLVGKFPLGTN